MKVLGVISVIFACVAARGSGPYLPSGWRPDGPAFYLPSEAARSLQKPLNEPVKEVIFSESEASGSDFLREYGPPKVQEVSQDILQQGLPDVINQQFFFKTAEETNTVKEDSNIVTQVAEQKIEVNAEVQAAEEPSLVNEPQSITTTESVTDVEEVVSVNDETSTLSNAVAAVDAVDEFGYVVEPTVAIVIPTEDKLTTEATIQSENEVVENYEVESQQLTNERQVEESVTIDTTQVTSEAVQSNSEVSEQAKLIGVESSEASTTQQSNINFDIISTVQEKIQTVEEEVKNVENVVQNIPELIVGLENEVKSQQTEIIQEVPAVVQGIFGSLDQAPEGFLEYGPPGFREYGPPREDLRDNTIEENIAESQAIANSEVRKRRFSPKFRSSSKLVKSHH